MAKLTIQKERERTEVYHRYVMGQSVTQISEEMGIPQPRVSNHISRTRRLYRKHVSSSHQKLAARRIAETDAMMVEAKLAWERSQKDAVEVVRKTSNEQNDDGSLDPTEEVTIKRKWQVGDPRFLTEWRQANRDGANIEGLLSSDSLLEEFAGERPVLLEVEDRNGAEPFLRQADVRVIVEAKSVAPEE